MNGLWGSLVVLAAIVAGVPMPVEAIETALSGTAVVTEAAATAPTATTDLAGLIEEHYRGIVDLTAKVVQKNYVRSVNKTQTFEGALSVKKPGRLRLEYTNGQTIVIDGKEAWFYSKKSEQAIRRTFRDFEQANIPVAFLLGAAEIRQEFDVTAAGPEEPRAVDLTPRKKERTTMKKLRLHADDAGRITRMVIHHRSGDSADIRFDDVREDAGLDDSRFEFKVPKGTEVIEQ